MGRRCVSQKALIFSTKWLGQKHQGLSSGFRGPPFPPIFLQSHAVFRQFYGKTPILSNLGSGPPLTKILNPRLGLHRLAMRSPPFWHVCLFQSKSGYFQLLPLQAKERYSVLLSMSKSASMFGHGEKDGIYVFFFSFSGGGERISHSPVHKIPQWSKDINTNF